METTAVMASSSTAVLCHHPVMIPEVLSFLCSRNGKYFFDGTIGGGGHAEAILTASAGDARLLGVDRDDAALAMAGQRLAQFAPRVFLYRANFSEAQDVLKSIGWQGFDGILLDLGFSSLQVEDAERGFSFQRSGPLDMRMDRRDAYRAADIINRSSEAELRRIFHDFGEERAASRLARVIVRTRAQVPFSTTTALVTAIERVTKRPVPGQLHPATRTFQALRIAVNRELDHLATFLRDGYQLLRPGGRMVILSYHSLEDRLVKTAFRRWAATCLCPPQIHICRCGWSPKVKILTPKPVAPTVEEVTANPRARSARLRSVERCEMEVRH
ncbi:MAG: 16S rRNA (cytosine(1402)-N(4))-methyltransferase RsmH [Candidatus Binatia bacterium]